MVRTAGLYLASVTGQAPASRNDEQPPSSQVRGVRVKADGAGDGAGAPGCPRDDYLAEDDTGWETRIPPSCCEVSRLDDDLSVAIVRAGTQGLSNPGSTTTAARRLSACLRAPAPCFAVRRPGLPGGCLGQAAAAGEGPVVGVGELAQVAGQADVVDGAENLRLQVVDRRERVSMPGGHADGRRPVPVPELPGEVNQRQVAVSR
jgi:hypothetical protein